MKEVILDVIEEGIEDDLDLEFGRFSENVHEETEISHWKEDDSIVISTKTGKYRITVTEEL